MEEYICEMTDDYPDVPYGDDEYSGTVERRERIVRCLDCEHAECYESGLAGLFILCSHFESEGCKAMVEPSGFCAWGEEREDR